MINYVENTASNTFLRMKKARSGIIFQLSMLFVIMIPLSVVAFANSLIFGAFLLIISYLFIFYIDMKYFGKDVFSNITIQRDGIDWVYKGVTICTFKWNQIQGVRLGSFMMVRTFDLVLPQETQNIYHRSIFKFECNEEVRTYIVENTDVQWVVEKFMTFDI